MTASLPSDVDVTGPSAHLVSVSCASVGNCSAVGTYQDSSFNTQGVLLSESGGGWQTGVKAILPSGASANPQVNLTSVSCASAGNCSAVGTYYDSSGRQGLLLTESGGVWQTGVKASPPSGVSGVTLSSVSCASAGNCSAVGTSYDSSSNNQVLLFSESSGAWQAGVKAVLPSDATTSLLQANLRSVSCASAGNCSAVGYYFNNSGEQGLLLSESGGVWQDGVKAALPTGAQSNPSASLTSVSCASAGNCSAVGTYSANSGSQGLLLSESGGAWQLGTNAVLPSGASSTNPGPNLRSVSCASAGNCSAVGNYLDSSNQSQGFLLSESGGAWQPGVQAILPSGAYSSPNVQLPSVSCPSAGNCTAAGTYYDTSGTVRQGLLLSESGGVWQSGVKAVLPSDASTSPSVGPPSVSCATADDCSVVGNYNDSSGRQQGFLLGATAASPAAPAAPGVSSPIDGQTVTGSGASGVSVPVAATGVPGATLSVSDGGSVLTTLPIDSGGNATGTVIITYGSHTLSFTQTTSGQTSSPTTVHVLAAPGAPGVSSPIDGQTVTGSGASGVSVPVAATGVPGATLSVSDGGSVLTTLPIDSGGNATGTVIITYGSHTLSFTQTTSGQTSSPTTVRISATAVRKLTVRKLGSGRGVVTSHPAGIDCPRTCSATFGDGTHVTLTVKARPGSRFEGWSGGCSGLAKCRLTVRAATTVMASFRRLSHAITFSLSSPFRKGPDDVAFVSGLVADRAANSCLSKGRGNCFTPSSKNRGLARFRIGVIPGSPANAYLRVLLAGRRTFRGSITVHHSKTSRIVFEIVGGHVIAEQVRRTAVDGTVDLYKLTAQKLTLTEYP